MFVNKEVVADFACNRRGVGVALPYCFINLVGIYREVWLTIFFVTSELPILLIQLRNIQVYKISIQIG